MRYVKTIQEIAYMKIAGKVLADTIELLKKNVRPGIDLLTLDKIAYNNILKNNCEPSFVNYMGYKHTICTSVNDVLIHGIPSKYIIKDKDLVSIDIGCSYKKLHVDGAFSMVCGKPNALQIKILNATHDALQNAINIIRPGVSIRQISKIIEETIIENGFFTPYQYTGHGIGYNLHEDPIVPNIESDAPNFILEANMTIAIEPMLIANSSQIFVAKDGWSVITKNNNLSCHAEHTVWITEKGCKILTH